MPKNFGVCVFRWGIAVCVLSGGAGARGEEPFPGAGWQTVRTVRCTIELQSPGDSQKFLPTRPSAAFQDGQKFRLKIAAESDLYVYVLVKNADGSLDLLDPVKPDQPALAKAGVPRYIPETGTFDFRPPAGTERLRIIAAPQKLPWVHNEEFLALENGANLTAEEQAALANLKGIRSKSLDAEVKRQKTLKSVPSLKEAARKIEQGTLSRGVGVVSVEEHDNDVEISITSPNKRDTSILVHELELKHR